MFLMFKIFLYHYFWDLLEFYTGCGRHDCDNWIMTQFAYPEDNIKILSWWCWFESASQSNPFYQSDNNNMTRQSTFLLDLNFVMCSFDNCTFTFRRWNQGWAIPGFGQLYYTNTILVEKLTILYYNYTNILPFSVMV